MFLLIEYMTDTELRLQYAELTWDIDFPENIEQVLEDDYVKNSDLYTSDAIKRLRMTYLICKEITPQQMLNAVHEYNKRM